ncbi:MAG TPA: S9 family peptidase [Acidimicrobiales bacterium]|jgi:dipeptidyl aminopeptidase/acylaminoacyl peptidase|nr:S9 family peptidase [Acidimicrobiales bacterium]
MAETQLIPRDVLFGNPEKAMPTISPDGRRIAYIAPLDGVLNVFVGEIGVPEPEPVTRDTDRGIRMYTWAHDNRHLLYLQDSGGDENWHIHRVDLETRETVDLTPFDNVQAQVVKLDKRHPNDALIGINKDNPQLHDVYRLDIASGELTKVAENPGFIGWVADDELQVRGAAAPTPDGGIVVVTRETEDAEWKPILQVGQEDALTTSPLGFDADGKGMYVISSAGVNAGRLVRLDAATGEVLEVIAEDPTYDVGGAMIHADTRKVQAVAFLRDRLEWQVIDEDVRADFEGLAQVSRGDMGIGGRDHADRTWLVGFTLDDGPVEYYSWDRETKQATFLFHQRPELRQYTLAKMEPFSFTSRDGLTIHGYLTFPTGVERQNLPTVLNVHGGPWARDTWGFNPEAQWFANRGYLCVQVNYRGSTGYGKEFVNAGDREWAGKMHDDLIDAVEHIVEKGYADRERVAIYGGSYGGYAALVGATFTPDVFRCAVDIVGPSNLKTLIESVPPYWAPMIAQFHTRVGNPETDEEFLWSRSPLSRVDEIKIPMLIAQGANDPRVKQAESEQIVAAMTEKGIEHDYMLFEDEGHGFAKPENRLKFYGAAERFLARNLGGRYEEPPTDLKE